MTFVVYTNRFKKSFASASPRVQKDFAKQIGFLRDSLRHPSVHAKKYDESSGVWQGRVNREWRFYFTLEGETITLVDIIAHPK